MKVLSLLNFIGLLFSACILYLLDTYGIWVRFISHPFWSSNVSLIGMGIGLILTIIVFSIGNWSRSTAVWLVFVLLTIAAYFVTAYAKETFAASYAEDMLAGKIWYFGFMGGIACLFVVLAMIPPKFFRAS